MSYHNHNPHYTESSTPVTGSGAQPHAPYGGGDVHHFLENGQSNSWLSSDTSQFDTGVHVAVVDEQLLHAPVPLSGQQPLFFSAAPNYSYLQLQQLLPQVAQETGHGPSSLQEYYPSPSQGQLTDLSNLGDLQYPQEAPTRTFPTPSELLVELASTNSNARGDLSRNSSDLSTRPPRRSRLVGRSLGVIPGEPTPRETISSHEKKRQYLECLEYYVMYLQQQLNLVGAEPVPLERVPQYRGLNNRSIRTLLVHMQSTTERLNMRRLREEQRFVQLREAIYSQDAASATVQVFQENEGSLNRNFFR